MPRPRERRDTGEQDLFRARLDQILNMQHELVRLAWEIDWPALECNGYHNKEWAAMMQAVGLVPSDTAAEGGKMTGQGVSHYGPMTG